MKKIFLMGNPNVGKSVVFNRLTGARVISSNYPGTTVEFSQGRIHLGGEYRDIIDVPGTYSLDPTTPAEKVAVRVLNEIEKEGDAVIVNVLDSTNLERNLSLTLQLLDYDIPMVICLNIWDEAKHQGTKIDVEKLSELLDCAVIPTVAITGEGIKSLVEAISTSKKSNYKFNKENKWGEIGRIIEAVQVVSHRHHTFSDRLSEITIHPIGGIPVALVVLFICFEVIRFIGEGLIAHVFDPIFEILLKPIMMFFSKLLTFSPLLHNILIGELIEGEIDFGLSFGVLTTGLYVPFAAVLPYVFSFYLVLSILEDSGYLPRLAILVDRIMHKLGLHGMAIIPMMLGLGCNVPGVLGSRILETKRERFIAMTLIAIAVPCMAQIAMIFGLIGEYGFKGLFAVFFTLFAVWIILGMIMSKFVKGESPEIFLEIPPYRFPHIPTLFKKLLMRIKGFLKEAIPFVLIGVFIVNILYISGIFNLLGKVLEPIVKTLFGLPVEAVGALIVGFLRKDIAVGMLAPLGLSLKQLIISSVILTMYFPCVAAFVMLVKELGFWGMIKSTIIMLTSTAIVGIILNLIL